MAKCQKLWELIFHQRFECSQQTSQSEERKLFLPSICTNILQHFVPVGLTVLHSYSCIYIYSHSSLLAHRVKLWKICEKCATTTRTKRTSNFWYSRRTVCGPVRSRFRSGFSCRLRLRFYFRLRLSVGLVSLWKSLDDAEGLCICVLVSVSLFQHWTAASACCVTL